jgi:hypothetical protein
MWLYPNVSLEHGKLLSFPPLPSLSTFLSLRVVLFAPSLLPLSSDSLAG